MQGRAGCTMQGALACEVYSDCWCGVTICPDCLDALALLLALLCRPCRQASAGVWPALCIHGRVDSPEVVEKWEE